MRKVFFFIRRTIMCRKLILLTSFVLVLGLCPHLAHGDVGLVGYWKFDLVSPTAASPASTRTTWLQRGLP